MNFVEVDQRYIELRQQYVAGSITAEQFDDRLRALMVQDDLGRWWAKARKTGDWHYYDAVTDAWVEADPRGEVNTTTAPSVPDNLSDLAQTVDTPLASSEPLPPLADDAVASYQGPPNEPNRVVEGEPTPPANAAPAAPNLPKWAAVKPASVAQSSGATGNIIAPGTGSQTPATTQYSARDFKPIPEVRGGLKALFYLLSFFIPVIGVILFFVYRKKPAPEDRLAARTFLILGIVSLIFSCACGSTLTFWELAAYGNISA